MTYTVKVGIPNVGKGVLCEIPGLGVFKNGSSNDVDDERLALFLDWHGAESLDDEKKVGLQEGVTVTKAARDTPPPPPPSGDKGNEGSGS